MNITEALRAHLVKTFGMDAKASDDVARALVSAKLASGEFTTDKFVELTATKTKSGAQLIGEQIAAAVAAANAPVLEALKGLGKTVETPIEVKAEEDPALKGVQAKLDAMVAAAEARVKAVSEPTGGRKRVTPFEMLNPAPRVKSAIEQYDRSTKAVVVPEKKDGRNNTHPLVGKSLVSPAGHTLNEPSQLDLACAGAFWKSQVNRIWPQGRPMPKNLVMTEHDEQVMQYVLHESPWIGEGHDGSIDEIKSRKLSGVERNSVGGMCFKDLLNDGTSGGQDFNLVPQVFDDIVITIPLLNGELFPNVDLTTIPRGASVRTPEMLNLTITNGPFEGSSTPIGLQSTAGLITALDTNIYNATGAIQIGEDFLEDSLVDVGRLVQNLYGQAFLTYLDHVIAVGDGSTQPLGIFNSSGTTILAAANGTNGPFVVGDFEKLMFGIPKATRESKGGKTMFVSTDATYRRARAVSVSSTDQRRIFGYDNQAYTCFDRPFKVQNDIGAQQIAYVNMGWYRMWRRRGLTFRTETQGYNLALNNTILIVVRARYGGRLLLGTAMAQMDDAPASG